MTDMYARMAASHPKLAAGAVWCRTCGAFQSVDSAECLRSGWPKCCGYTMTLDPPDEPDELSDYGGLNPKEPE